MKIRYQVFIGSALVISGLLLGIPFWTQFISGEQQSLDQGYVANAAPVDTAVPYIGGTPNTITFPNLGISRTVKPGYYNEKTREWTLSTDAAHFATPTSEPNNKSGNTFIYGHNRNEVFTPLLNLSIGDTAQVATENGYTFEYKLVSIRDVDPNDSSPLQPTSEPILTVQTCAGAWYQDRRIFVFTLEESR